MQPFHMQKRISHKPKTYLLKIEPIEETVQEDKALELVHDGIVLTKEMMDQIEVSDSDEVEVEPKEEEKVEKKEAEVGDDSSEAEVFEYVKPVQVQDTVRKYAVLDILNATGEPVEITLDRTIFRKRDTNVSRFRLEMNKMAWSNVDEVIKTIRKIRLDKHEMKACAEIFFEKAVTEQTFCVLYAYAINILREYYYNRELADKEKAFNAAILAPIYNEKGEQIFEAIPDDLNSNRGYLFNVMLEHLGKTIKTFKTWKYDPTGMSNEEADEALISSNNYKDRIFGAFRFATILGLNQVVNEEIIRIALEGLIERGIQDEEAEIAGIVLKMCANELYMLYPTMFDTMIDELKAYIPRSQDNKVKYNTMMIIDEMLKIKQNGGGEKSAYLEKRIKGGDLTCEKRELYDTNATERLQFKRGLKLKDAKTYERKQRTERRSETKEHKKDLIVNNPFNGLQSTGSEKLNGEEIKYVHDITEELHFYSDEDKEQTLEDIQNDIKAKKISNSSLVAAFIYNAVKDKEMKLIIEYCMKCIKTLRLNTELVNIGVKRASMSLEDLIVDFPKARENFEYACCSFMSKGLMDLSDFKQYDIDAAYIEKFGESLDEIARQKFVE